MRAVIQRVKNASVTVAGEIVGETGKGLLILLGVEAGDTDADCDWLVERILKLRVFEDAQGRMNLALPDIADVGALVVSQFTLLGSLKKGNRPSFNRAAPPEIAEKMYLDFGYKLSAALGRPVPTGKFRAMMDVALVNDGPVTLVVDSRQRDF